MAYTCTPLSKEQLAGTSNYRVIWGFTSDTPATEPPFQKELTITPDMSIQQGREWLYYQITNAKPKKSVADLIVVGTPVTPLQPAAPAGPTADETWVQNASRYRALKALLDAGISVGQATTDLAAMKSTVEAGYTTARAALL
jgi:hypothetical protein